jgi:hypothetical protein
MYINSLIIFFFLTKNMLHINDDMNLHPNANRQLDSNIAKFGGNDAVGLLAELSVNYFHAFCIILIGLPVCIQGADPYNI